MTQTERPCEAPKALTLKTLKALLSDCADGGAVAACPAALAALGAIRESCEKASSFKAWNEEALAADVFPAVVSCLRSEDREVL